MPCTSCIQNLNAIKPEVSDWLNQDQVRSICEPCYFNMIKNNITKVKRQTLLDKFQGQTETMKFYEIFYKGPENTKFNLGGHTIHSNGVIYFGIDELPITVEHLKELPNVVFSIIEREAKPNSIQAKAVAKALSGEVGIKWVGPSPMRMNDHGKFKKNEVVWVSKDSANKLMALGGFELV